jgi:rod shape-determining protein MreD
MPTLPPPVSFDSPATALGGTIRGRTVLISLLAAFLFDLVPWHDLPGMPDLVPLAIVFWAIHQPRRFGVGRGFVAGLLLDGVNGVLLGQHALAGSLLAFGGNALARRIPAFGVWAQAAHVLVLLVLAQVAMLAVRLTIGGTFPGWSWFAASGTTALLWPLTHFAWGFGQRLARGADASH